jgi:transposase-like protein
MPRQWRTLLEWFIRGLSSAHIARETHLDRKRILRALTVVRSAMAERIPAELDHGRDRLRSIDEDEANELQRRTAKSRAPVLGLYASHGLVWASLLSDAEAIHVGDAVRDRGTEGLDWPGLDPYIAVIYRGRLYRVAESKPSTPFGQIEAFWAYLQRRLRSKGGIRRARLGLYLAEYAWRYNHRKVSPADQLRELMKLIRKNPIGVRNSPIPRARMSLTSAVSPPLPSRKPDVVSEELHGALTKS